MRRDDMTPWLEDPDVRLYHGDCLKVLRELPDRSVHMCATSPPFYGLRDYGTDGQIGLEETPAQWVARLCDIFDEVKRVLRDDATCWIEIGDSFDNKQLVGQPWRLAFALQKRGWFLRSEIIWARRPNPMPESVTDRPTKSHSTVFLLSKQPRYFYDADAIREAYAEGYSYKGKSGISTAAPYATTPNGGDRRNAFSQHRNYAPTPPPQLETLDGSAGESPRGPDGRRVTAVKGAENSEQHRDGERWPNPAGANARSVWTIPTEPTPFAHFATFPQALVRRMILAGTSEKGCCPECGKPWVRQTERGELVGRTPGDGTGYESSVDQPHPIVKHGSGPWIPNHRVERTTLGWSPSCNCAFGDGLGPRNPIPCTVLDPFAGSGTTMLVARNHGRHSIGIELNQSYLEIAARRLQQLSLLA